MRLVAKADSPDRKLYLLDGNSLAYRAFFALPDTFVNAKGMPTGALFGLANMWVKLLEDNDHGIATAVISHGFRIEQPSILLHGFRKQGM